MLTNDELMLTEAEAAALAHQAGREVLTFRFGHPNWCAIDVTEDHWAVAFLRGFRAALQQKDRHGEG